MSNQPTAAQYAKIYAERYGWHLVPIEPGRKFPTANDWGNKTLSEPAQAFAYWELHKDWNMGVALGASCMCSLDIDDADGFQVILDEFGIPASELDHYPTILGRGKRIMFRVPAGLHLPYCKVNWPKQDDHKKHFTVFELRSATDGSQKQDVLPPSWHDGAQRNYEWIVKPPKTLAEWPEPPAWLLAIWQAWDAFKPQLVDACPWKPKQEHQQLPRRTPKQSGGMPDVSGLYCAQNDIQATLERYGYKRKGKRYLSPHSGTGLPGVHLLDNERCWIHHASDPLCSEETGKPVSSYDLFCYYEQGGDYSKAFKAAAELLGVELKKPVLTKPAQEYLPAEVSQPSTVITDHAVNPDEPLPYCTEKGKPLAHIANLAEVCKRLGVQIRYNVISKEEEIIIPGQGFSLDNEANASLAWLESECSLFSMPTAKLPSFVTYLADRNQYNPVAEWVNSKPWDGQDHLGKLLDTVTIKDADNLQAVMLKDTLITRWMISAIAGAFSPKGVSAHGVLVFQGEQYVGKTKWFKSLVPEDKNLIKDGVILKPDDRDSVKQAVSFWLVELGELDSTFRKSDIAALKAFITNDKDVLRRAYARKESQYARRTVFFGSVNPKQFLHDPTGNRRYWTIEVAHLNHSHNIDTQQVWAQVHNLWISGSGYYLTPDEMAQLNSHNEEFTAIDPIDEIISTKYDWQCSQDKWCRWVSASDVLVECGYQRPSKADATAAGIVIRKLNGGIAKRTGSTRLLLMPPIVIS